MTGRLDGKVAIVTGAAMGMGRSTAELFAREGATVALCDLNETEGETVTQGIVAEGGQAQFWRLDVTSEADVERVVGEVIAAFGPINVLINCAGIIGPDKPTHEIAESEWDALFAVDVKGVFFMTKHVVPSMIEQRAGSIVNFSSIYGLIASEDFTVYHAAKGAVTMMTKQDASMYGQYNIRVNAVNPATVLTPLVRGIAEDFPGGLPAYEAMMTANLCLHRMGRPEEVAYACLFLASDECTWLTGVNLPIDGGYTAR